MKTTSLSMNLPAVGPWRAREVVDPSPSPNPSPNVGEGSRLIQGPCAVSNGNWKRALILGAGLLIGSAVQAGPLADRVAARWRDARAELLVSLNLTSAQQAALGNVEAARTQFRVQLRDEVPQLINRVKVDLANPAADLRATVSLIHSTVDRQIASHRVVSARQLDFYDSLDPVQRSLVRAELTRKVEAVEQLRSSLLDLVSD